jgi:hypothetical protein
MPETRIDKLDPGRDRATMGDRDRLETPAV